VPTEYPASSGGGNDQRKRSMIPEVKIQDFMKKNKQLCDKIAQIQPKFREVLKDALTEDLRRNNFSRIYPSRSTKIHKLV
jgi:hypothetical protein